MENKFKEAFDTLVNNINAKIEEAKANVENLAGDIKTQVEGQQENLKDYQEKITQRLQQIVDVDKIKSNVLAETENFVDDLKVRIDNVFDLIQKQFESFEKSAATTGRKAEKKVKDTVVKASARAKKTTIKAEKTTTSRARKAAKKRTANAKAKTAKPKTERKASTRTRKVAEAPKVEAPEAVAAE